MEPHPTIFLVEDDPDMRESIAWFLETHGYRVNASGSIAEALASYNPTTPGCLVLDVQLPEGTGLELYDKFREMGGAHPFIVMTAYGRVPLAVEAMRLGAIDFLQKPFENDQLLQRVEEAIEIDSKTRQLDEEAQAVLRRIQQLAPREWQIAKLLAAGEGSKSIASQLNIKSTTVDIHRHHILSKLEVETSAGVAALVAEAHALQRMGLIKLPDEPT